jgi:serine/threonine-protein phosphatase PGAM5
MSASAVAAATDAAQTSQRGQPDTAPVAEDTHDLIITHNFLAGWFVRHALDAPEHRWLGLNHGNCALTVILYRPDRPPALLSFNDVGHLPAELRFTGVPSALHI